MVEDFRSAFAGSFAEVWQLIAGMNVTSCLKPEKNFQTL